MQQQYELEKMVYTRKSVTFTDDQHVLPAHERILFNVRGKEYETHRSTLEFFPKTLLGSEKQRRYYYNPYSQKYHFDTREDVFDAILFFYQSKGILARPDFIAPGEFWKQLLFFGLARPKLKEKKHLPNVQWKKFIWVLLEHPELSFYSKLFAIVSTFMIIASVSTFCLETLFEKESAVSHIHGNKWFYTEMTFIIFFTAEYAMRLLTAPNRKRFIKSILGLIDLSCILPFYFSLYLIVFHSHNSDFPMFSALRGLRLIQVNRMFKLIRYSEDLKNLTKALIKSFRHMISMFYLFSIAVLFCSCIIYISEYKSNPMFDSVFHTMWFTVVSMTTVGYGDVVPLTRWGQLATAATIFCGTVTMFYLFLPVYCMLFDRHYHGEIEDEFEVIPQSDLK